MIKTILQKCHSRHKDKLEGQRGYIPMCIGIAVKHRKPTSHLRLFAFDTPWMKLMPYIAVTVL